jgi:PAS domain S-box-containing protein
MFNIFFKPAPTDAAEETAKILKKIFNRLDAYVCITVPGTGEILFLNDHLRKNSGIKGDGVGQRCYELLQYGLKGKCDFCPDRLLEKEPDKVIVWEQPDQLTNKTYRKTAMYIDWPGQKAAHLEYGVDVTDINQTREILEYREKILTALNKAAAVFLSQRDENFLDVMTEGVGLIADALDLDRLSVLRNYKNADNNLCTSQIYRWAKDSGGTTEPNPAVKDISTQSLPHLEKILTAGQAVNSPARLLPDAAALQSFGCVSIFFSPIFINNDHWGVVIFEDLRNEHFFDDEQAAVMRTAAYLCASSVIREEMKREIAEQDELNRIMASAVPLGLTIWNDNLEIIDCNEAVAAICGLDSKEYFLKHFYDFSPEYQPGGMKSSDRARAIIKRVLDNDETIKTDWVHRTLTGELIPCEITLKRARHRGGHIVLGYAYDIRDIKKLEQSVVEAEERIKLILDSTPVCCTLWDSGPSLIDCNEAAIKLFGFTDKRDFMDSFFKLSPEYQPDGQRSHEKALACLRKAFTDSGYVHEWTHQMPDGTLMPSEVIFSRLNYKDGHIVAAYTLDRRENKRMLNEIEKALFEAQEANRAKREFLARMSHEMLTPMNAIMGLTQLIQMERGNNEEGKDYLDELDMSSRHLLRLIQDLLDMSGLEDNTFSFTESVFSFNRMFRDVLKEVGYLAIEKHQRLSYEFNPAIPSSLLGDSKRLSQVITNLLTNAIKFTPEKGEINFSASVLANDDNGVIILKIEVADTGIGISKEEQGRLFSVFEQLDGGLNRRYGGVGLGLVISKRIIELMGGDIWVDSEPGQGSKFTFTCKLKEA